MAKEPDIRILVGTEGGKSTGGALIKEELKSYFEQNQVKIKVKLDDVDIGSIKARIAEENNATKAAEATSEATQKITKENVEAYKASKARLELEEKIAKVTSQQYSKEQQKYYSGRVKEWGKDVGKQSDAQKELRNYYSTLEKVSAAEEKRNIRANETTANISAQAKLQEASFKQYLQTLNQRDLSQHVEEANNVLNDYKIAWNSTGDEQERAWKRAQNGAKTFRATMKDLGAEGGNVFTYLHSKLKTFIVYLASSAITMGVVSGIRSMIAAVYDLDEALTNLRIVTGYSKVDAQELLTTYNQMAQTLGSTTTEVAKSAVEWQRQGYNLKDTNELIEASMVLSVVGMVDSSEATKSLTSAIKGNYKYSLYVQKCA